VGRTWDEVPETIKNTFERLGIPDQERRILAGVGAQYESEVVYHSLKEEWEKQGVIFKGMDDGLREHEDIVREYFGTVVPYRDNLFAAVNTAVWSGGSFVYIPEGREARHAAAGVLPHQRGVDGAVRAHADHRGGGRAGPVHRGVHRADVRQDSFHSGVIEIIVKDGARCATRPSRTGRTTSTTW
jgi:Fe-S cluster assembly protein SufB